MRLVTPLAVAFAAGLVACAEINSQTASYGTLAEAASAGAITQGWVPDGLPAGAYEIRVGYVPDGPERWGLFNFPPGEGDALKGILGDEIDLDGLGVTVPARIEWWPVALRRTLDGESLRLTGLRGYRSRAGGFIVAVNWNQGRGYYWKAEG